MAKLQGLKRETVREIYGTVDYTIELTCGHRTRVTNKQLRGPERVWCSTCPDDAKHAQASRKRPLQDVVDFYNDPDNGYEIHLRCGHRIQSKTMHRDRIPKRKRCALCLESEGGTEAQRGPMSTQPQKSPHAPQDAPSPGDGHGGRAAGAVRP